MLTRVRHIDRREFFVLLLGLDNAGKTSLLERLKQIQNPKYGRLSRDKLTPTIGLNVGQLDLGKVTVLHALVGSSKAHLTMVAKRGRVDQELVACSR